MRLPKYSVFIFLLLLALLAGACSPIMTQSPSIKGTASHTSVPSMSISPPAIQNATQLPEGTPQASNLDGSGNVERLLLTYDDLMTGSALAPLDDGAFALPVEAAMPALVFEGRLQLSGRTGTGGSKVIRDDINLASDPARLQLPDLVLEFVQDGSYLIPVTQGLVYSGSRYWNTILGPGRIWQENGDRGYARASFPFTLVERNQNCTHNGLMAFLFDGTRVSQVRYQITQETCLYFKFDLWGQVEASYQPGSFPTAQALKAAHAAELANRLPTRPIATLSADYPASGIDVTRFGSGITPQDLTAYGLVMNGINYVSGCRTRHGEYPYCESLRLPSYSTAKSAFAAVALMRLGQKYGTGVYDLLIKDYVPETASARGDWSSVTFRNALDMATGNYDQAGFEIDEGGANMASFLDRSESYSDKMHYALLFPNQSPPGRVWVYHTSDTFIVTRAMNNYLVRQAGPTADIFNLVRDEVYTPLHLSAGALTTLRTDNRLDGAPFGGYGLFWTQDDIAKMALLLNTMDGRLNGTQILEPGLLAASLQKDPGDRGLDTSGAPVFKYRNGLWAREWTPAENPRYPCSFWTPFMSGYGGITVVLMPNGSIYYYFSDNNEFVWFQAVDESNKLKPMCP